MDKTLYIIPRETKLEQWGEGEWLDEPDIIEWNYKGVLCVIKRIGIWEGQPIQLSLGQLNGYINIPKEHPWFGKDCFREKSMEDIEVHGGLTFSGERKGGDWWIGFDCAHSGDIVPSMKDMKEQMSMDFVEKYPNFFPNGKPFWMEGKYRNVQFVKKEVENLADQFLKAKDS